MQKRQFNQKQQLIAFVVILLCPLSFAAGQLPDDIRKHFEEHLVGQWTTETTWGDIRMTGHRSVSWNIGGTSLTVKATMTDAKGVSHTTALVGWDDPSGTIVIQGFDSRGNNWTIRWNRHANGNLTEWTGVVSGSEDGKKWESPTKLQCTKDGSRYEDTTDGKPFVMVTKRVTAEAEQPYEIWLKYLAGKWEVDEGDGRTGMATYQAAGTTPALVFHGEAKDFSIAGVIGWRADLKMLVETDFHTQRAGVQGNLDREYAEITRDSIKGRGKFRDSSGASGNHVLEYRRINDNEMTLTGTGGTGTPWQVKFKRAK